MAASAIQTANVPRGTDPKVLLEQLTEREKEIFLALLDGKTNREIAEHLSITENTAKQHLKRVYEVMGVDSCRRFFPNAAALTARLAQLLYE